MAGVVFIIIILTKLAKEISESKLMQIESELKVALRAVGCRPECPGETGLPREGFYITLTNRQLPVSQLYPGNAEAMAAVLLACWMVSIARWRDGEQSGRPKKAG